MSRSLIDFKAVESLPTGKQNIFHALFLRALQIILKQYMTDIKKYKLQDIAVAIVDDHELVLEGFKSGIARSGLADVTVFSSATALLTAVDHRAFDVYIIDVELPDMDVAQLIDGIRVRQPEARIIINTMHEEMWLVNKIVGMNVSGVMYKSGSIDQLLEAIITVMEGRRYFCPKFMRAQRRLSQQNDVPSQREIEVLKNIARGHSTKKIAEILYISENTVENHRKSLFRKLHAHNMAELIVRSIAAGYIVPEEMDTNT